MSDPAEQAEHQAMAALSEDICRSTMALGNGHPKRRLAQATVQVCIAVMRSCAKPGQEAEALQDAATYMLARAKELAKR